MKLRLVNASDRALPCRYTCGGQNPATMLLSLNGQPALPCCDRCARVYYDMRPDMVQMGPLDGYVDMFAAAKEAALATPEQVIESLVSKAYEAISLRIRRDRKLYCQEYWCCQAYSQSEQLTAADVATQVAGHAAHLSCNDCARKRQEDRGYDQVKVYPLDERFTTVWWKIFDEAGASRTAPASSVQQQYAPQQDHVGPWYTNPDVVNAALVSGVVIASHEASKHHKARLRNSALGITPLNNVAAGAKRAIYRMGRPADAQEGIQYELEQLNTANPKWTRP